MELWPENEPAFALFTTINTQWRIGMGGPTGLDYNVLFSCMERMQLSPEAFDQIFADVRVIEIEALSILNKKE